MNDTWAWADIDPDPEVPMNDAAEVPEFHYERDDWYDSDYEYGHR